MLHLLTIGQSPRPDVTPELLRIMEYAGPVTEAGALDGLAPDAVPALDPGEVPLVSRLRGGGEVLMGEGFAQRRMAELVDRVPPGEVAAILCTGPFPGIADRPGLIKAGPAFDRALERACAPGTTLGVLIPDPRQEDDARRRVPPGCRAIVKVASPYSGAVDPQCLRGADLIALNCFGYEGELEKAVAAATGRPVLLARRVLAERLRFLLPA